MTLRFDPVDIEDVLRELGWTRNDANWLVNPAHPNLYYGHAAEALHFELKTALARAGRAEHHLTMKKPKTPKEIIESHNAHVYVMLAKAGLWLVSATLVSVVLGGIYATAKHVSPSVIGNVVQACQVLAMIAITVLGYHGYKGHRLFHELRHINDPPEEQQLPEAVPYEGPPAADVPASE